MTVCGTAAPPLRVCAAPRLRAACHVCVPAAARVVAPAACLHARRRTLSCRAGGDSGQALQAPAESWDDVFAEAEAAELEATVAPAADDGPRTGNRVFLVGVAFKQQQRQQKGPRLSIEDSLDELAHLADTAGLVVCGRTHQNLDAQDGRTYVGSGKLNELLEQARALDVDTLIFDDELRPSQARNVERAAVAIGSSMRICDRVELILDIFRQRAATREGIATPPRAPALPLPDTLVADKPSLLQGSCKSSWRASSTSCRA